MRSRIFLVQRVGVYYLFVLYLAFDDDISHTIVSVLAYPSIRQAPPYDPVILRTPLISQMAVYLRAKVYIRLYCTLTHLTTS